MGWLARRLARAAGSRTLGMRVASEYLCRAGRFCCNRHHLKRNAASVAIIVAAGVAVASIFSHHLLTRHRALLVLRSSSTPVQALKHGGITGMMDRLDNPSKMKCAELASELKTIMKPLYDKHQNDIITGHFSSTMMADWDNNDVNLHKWRAETAETGFEKTPAGSMTIPEQEYFDNAVLMVAMVKAGVELAFEAMVDVGIKPESAYYESLHETPLIANTIARMKLYEMNSVISDTAEYGCYLYDQACRPLLTDFMAKQSIDVIGKKYNGGDNGVDNRALNAVNEEIRTHPVEVVGKELRGYMTAMEKISTDAGVGISGTVGR